jgi:hypothetical protein
MQENMKLVFLAKIWLSSNNLMQNRLFQASRRTDYNRLFLPDLDANAYFYLLFRRPLTATTFCHKLGL